MFQFVSLQSEVLPVMESDIKRIEELYGFLFPKELREFYLKHNGRAIFRTEVISEDIEITPWIFLPLAYGRPSVGDVINSNDNVFNSHTRMYPFAMDTQGRYICWSGLDESVAMLMPQDNSFISVCKSVQDFFLMMDAYCQAIKEWDQRNEYNKRSEESMDETRFVPLGSVVLLHGGTQKVMVIGRGLNVNDNGVQYYFDYGGVLYPNGFEGERVAYFNHENIERVFFAGYDDDDNEMMNVRLNEYVNAHPDIKRRRIE